MSAPRKVSVRVEFKTDTLVDRAVEAIRRMEKIEIPRIHVTTEV